MGCNTSSVVPLAETEVGGAGIKVRVNPSTPETMKLSPRDPLRAQPPALESSEPPAEILSKDFNSGTASGRNSAPPPMAFQVPVNEDSIIRRHPPKRFRRLEDQRGDRGRPLTREAIDSKQHEAEARRKDILSQRVRSALKNSRGRKTEEDSDQEKKV